MTIRLKQNNAIQTTTNDQSQNRLLAAIKKTSFDGFCIINNQQRFIEVNNAYCEITGYTREELLNMTINDLASIETHEETSSRVNRVIENGSELFQTGVRRKDGSVSYFEISATYLPDDDGHFICFSRDITDRLNMTELLQKNIEENAFKSELLYKAPVIAAFHDRDQNIIWANQAYEEATRAQLHDIIGKKCYSAWNLTSLCKGCPVSVVLETGENHEVELTPENQEHWPNSQGCWLSKASAVRNNKGNIIGAIEVAIDITKRKQAEAEILKLNEELEQKVLDRTVRLENSNLDLIHTYDATIEGWVYALSLKDDETMGHSQRVTYLTQLLAKKIGFSKEEIVHIRRGALLHDIGKMGVPDSILLKPGKLTDEEWVIMRKHPVFAYEMLSSIDYLRPALDIPYCHHEKWDGSGYPQGLKGEEIPLAARIFAIIDVFDALTSDRPYRKAWPYEKAIEYIKEQSGIHFDPTIVNEFLELIVTQEINR